MRVISHIPKKEIIKSKNESDNKFINKIKITINSAIDNILTEIINNNFE